MRRVSAGMVIATLAALCVVATPASANSTSGLLRAGAGQADITPPQMGYYLGGWTRADRLANGQSTRLYANALVLQRGTTKVALVAVELFAVPAGLQEDVARKVADLGYTKETIVLQADHTHSGPGGYFNAKTYNTAAPSVETVDNPISFYELLNPKPADTQLYTFLVDQIAAAIRRANGDRALATAGWGHTELLGVTQNRSIEAHLADHGIHVPFGKGTVAMDPLGYADTIDPNVDVLRVDKLVRNRHGKGRHHVPIGAWSEFANHGTVVKSDTEAYSGDHQATAWRDFVDRVRKASHIPNNQTVVDVYPNSDEGDQTAGIQHTGIDGAIQVGSEEAKAMFAAWKGARTHLSQTPDLDLRWTRTCFCGRMTATGPVDSSAEIGIGFLTGSEEGRGPLYDLTHVPFEGVTSPVDSPTDPAQGDKIGIPETLPPAVPITVLRVGDGVIATVPGEPTKETGTRIRAAVLDAMKGSGVTHAVIAGLANDYISYVATPEEYETQSYEGASTAYGRNESTFFQEQLADLGRDLAQGKPAPDPYPFDPSYGIHPDGPPYPVGADHGTITQQPAPSVARGATMTMAWDGGPSGHDRPVDRAFIRAERRVGHRWRVDDTDLGLGMLWRVDDQGHYSVAWTPVKTLPAGTYRFDVTATRYELISRTFRVTP